MLASLISFSMAAQGSAFYTKQDYCYRADLVVVADVSSTTTWPASDIFGGVATEAHLDVLAVAKGPPLTSFTVVVPGGSVDGGMVEASAWPLLAKGGRWLLVLFTGVDDKLWVFPDYGFQEINSGDPIPTDYILRQQWQAFCTGGQ